MSVCVWVTLHLRRPFATRAIPVASFHLQYWSPTLPSHCLGRPGEAGQSTRTLQWALPLTPLSCVRLWGSLNSEEPPTHTHKYYRRGLCPILLGLGVSCAPLDEWGSRKSQNLSGWADTINKSQKNWFHFPFFFLTKKNTGLPLRYKRAKNKEEIINSKPELCFTNWAIQRADWGTSWSGVLRTKIVLNE